VSTGAVLPADIPAERAVLAALLADPERVPFVADTLEASWFYLERHAAVYEAMLACYHRREAVSVPAVGAELRRGERLAAAGGYSFLGELAAEPVAPALIGDYARAVEQTATRRRLIETGAEISVLGYDEADDLDATLDKAEAALFAVSQRRQAAASTGAEMGQAANELWALITREDAPDPLRYGIPDLDARVMLNPGEMSILAARPGGGKTSLGMCIARHNAETLGRRVGYYSLEMSREVLTARYVTQLTGIPVKDILERRADLSRVGPALGRIGEWPIHIADRFELTAGGLRAHARQHHARRPWDLLIVDYLQLLGGSGQRNSNRERDVAEISRGLVTLARELSVPILALCQLNRAVEGRAVKMPQLSDLRESGSLEQDARVVLFIHREEVYDPNTDKRGIADIAIAKNNNGETGPVGARYDAARFAFAPLERYRAAPGYDGGEEYADAA
jgi:replicative DNA helicase